MVETTSLACGVVVERAPWILRFAQDDECNEYLT
jgi:hypothetical protein